MIAATRRKVPHVPDDVKSASMDARRSPGRPRASPEPLARLSAAIPTTVHDALCRQAAQHRVTLSQWVRHVLTRTTSQTSR
jgi:predicted HicB family RNase H-like nuclease